ncbi:hypothetical protein CSUB01_05825 [Colletotrichum sublineola]|uniref:Uncharacterized protein n=1 Tax=Colletotrichum sublineola TaxID=1173701 RepID=A0A066XJV4_COLSU|nr:hypothetical protein CSUB01_05825 [Colletotrichum sublineola]
MLMPNRSLPGWDEPESSSSCAESAVAPQSAPPSGLEPPTSIVPLLAFIANISSSLTVCHFEVSSPEVQQKVLRAFDWLLLPQKTLESLEVKRRAKQAEADLLAKAIRSCEEADQEAVNFLHSVLLSNDDERDSPPLGLDAN